MKTYQCIHDVVSHTCHTTVKFVNCNCTMKLTIPGTVLTNQHDHYKISQNRVYHTMICDHELITPWSMLSSTVSTLRGVVAYKRARTMERCAVTAALTLIAMLLGQTRRFGCISFVINEFLICRTRASGCQLLV